MLTEIDLAILRLVREIQTDDPDRAATLALAMLNLSKTRETLAHSLKKQPEVE